MKLRLKYLLLNCHPSRRLLPERRLRLVGGQGEGGRQEAVRAHDAGKDVPQRQEEPADHI